MYSTAIGWLTTFAGCAAAKKCTNTLISLDLSARQGVFDIAIPQTNLEVTDFILNATQQGRNFSDIALTGYDTISGVYNISTQFCEPSKMISNSSTVQVLTHGVGFDKSYWDIPFNDFNYSYVDVATNDYNYFTLSFDRLGLGKSSLGEPLNEIQIFLEIAAVAQLTMMLRNGTFPGSNHTFEKVVHVGHSYGSAITYALADQYPTLSDGLVLTGFSTASFQDLFLTAGNFELASANQPLRFGNLTGLDVQSFLFEHAGPFLDFLAPIDLTSLPEPQTLPNGYLVSADVAANKHIFFKPHFFDPAILLFAEGTKQPVTLGELLSLGSLPSTNKYAGPVMVINGDFDLPFCGNDCWATGGTAPSIPAMVKTSFPNVESSDFTAYVHPNTGHGINLHYNATGAFKVIQEFLYSKNL